MTKNFVGRFLDRIAFNNGDEERRKKRREAAEGLVKGYQRVPSHGTISASTTSTSLVTDFDPSHYARQQTFTFEPALKEQDDYEPEDEDEQQEDFETTRLHFQQHRQISIGTPKMEMDVKGANVKGDNIRNAVPYVKQLSSDKMKEEYGSDQESTPYKPTTFSINFKSQFLAAISVSLANMVVGFTTGYTSPALTTLANSTTISATIEQQSWIGGMMPLAALVGGLIGGVLIVRCGRRNTLLVTAVPFVVSWLIIATATDVYIIYVGRALGGLCVGIGSLVVPVYLGETMQPEIRGQLGLLPTALGNIGILVCFVAGMYMDWSTLAYFGAVLPLPFLLLASFIPETPRWYVTRGNHKAAKESLLWLRGKNADVSAELKDIVNSHEEALRSSSTSPFELFRSNNLRPVGILIGLMLFQQLSGINAVIFYTVTIFENAGSTINENISTIIVGVVNFAATFVATFLIDRLGRKILLYTSSVMMTLTLGVLGTFFYLKSTNVEVDSYGWLPLAAFVLYVIGFSLGFGPIPWLMMGEILPGRIKGSAGSFATAFNWSCTFLVTKTFLIIVKAIGEHYTFWMFAVICAMGLLFTICFVPETKGKSLEDIEQKMNPGRK